MSTVNDLDTVTERHDPGIDFATGTRQVTGDGRTHTDADSMRRRLSIPPYDRAAYDYPEVYPNLVEHYHAAPEGRVPTGRFSRLGGTELLMCEKPGNGKSTLLLNLAVRVLDENQEAVIWRGSQKRSEWTPLAPWACLCLPESCRGEIEARLDPADETEDPLPVALEDVARSVEWYETPVHLNHEILRPGRVHVIYPDPYLTGCQEVYENAEAQEAGVEFAAHHPVTHWWYAYLLARMERGPNLWTTLIFDEFKALVGKDVSKDDYATYQKVKLLAESWVDFRRKGVTIWGAGHAESEIQPMILKKIEWRAELTGNPTRASQVVGVDNVPMNTNLARSYNFDEYLLWTEDAFERRLTWVGLPDSLDRELSINLPTAGVKS